MAESIKDKVAIVGMGCTKFGERWNADAKDMITEAVDEAFKDAGVEIKDIRGDMAGNPVGYPAFGRRRRHRHTRFRHAADPVHTGDPRGECLRHRR